VIRNKKQTFGQYFTSRTIADFMVKLISEAKKEGKILDPGTGKGVFLESLRKSGYKNVFAYEIDKEFFREVSEAYQEYHVIGANFLESSKDEKFEVIIGNPPYVHWNDIEKNTKERLTKGGFWKPYINGEWDLLYAFIIWSIEKVKDEGEVIFIVPYYWFNSTFAYSLRKYLSKKGVFELIIHMGEYKLFPDCAPNNIIFKFRKTKDSQKFSKKTRVIEYIQRTGDLEKILEKIEEFLNKKLDEDYIHEDENFRVFFQDGFSSNLFWSLMHFREKELIQKIEKSSLQQVPIVDLEDLCGSHIIHNQVEDGVVPINYLLDSKDIRLLKLKKKKLLKLDGKYYHKDYKTSYLKLKQVLNVGVGMVTGYDKAFLVKENLLKRLNPNENKVIYSFIKGKSCRRFWIDEAIPYIFADNIKKEKELKMKYPNIYEHLINYKNKLNSRYKSKNTKFYQWATVRNLSLFTENLNKEKIFVPCLDRHKKSRFSYTREPYYGSGDVLVITKKAYPKLRESLKYVCAWLNSEMLNEWYKLKGTKRGHRTSYTQTRVEEIPIRLIKWEDQTEVKIYHEIIGVFNQILDKKDNNKKLDSRLDKLINSLIIN